MISKFFINRPVFATVISIIISIAGLLAMKNLPVEQYPDIVPPEISVSANYPGASAEVLAETIAAPLEQEINGADNMIYMTSTSSSSGSVNIRVAFEIGTDPDQAQIDVNNRIKVAEIKLPEDVRRQGVKVEKKSSNILMVLSMSSSSPLYDAVYVSNYALLNVIDELKRVKGVGNATLFGAKDYSMRIWLRPDVLAQYNMTPSDVITAIREQNSQFAVGQFGQEPLKETPAYTYSVTTKGRLLTPEEFGNIILRTSSDTEILRLKDVAKIELGAVDYSFSGACNNQPAVPIGIFLQPGANALETANAVKDKIEELSLKFPQGIKYNIPFNTTKFVEVSIDEVIHTFFEAILLVVLVVYIFLQSPRVSIIPILAVPVSIIGTFAGLYALGFSINLLTLFAMILAIGIVVDDAIIVIENIERIMSTEKIPVKQAAIKAMKEVTGPVIAIVLVLTSVFLPIAFLGGMSGQMFRQFAVTIAVSVTISGIVALSLTPALCVQIIKAEHIKHTFPFFNWFNKTFDKITDVYINGVKFFLRNVNLSILLFFAMIAITFIGFKFLPKGLLPAEDQGHVIMAYMLPPASSLKRTEAVTSYMSEKLNKHPLVQDVMTFTGFDILSSSMKTSSGVSFLNLQDWSMRGKPSQDARVLVNEFMGIGLGAKEGIVMAFNPPPIMGMSMTGGFEGYIQNRSGENYYHLMAMVNKIVEEASKRPELKGVRTTFSTSTPQYYFEVDREKARTLGVTLDALYASMQSTFGSYYVNDFTLFGRNYKVNLQGDAEFRKSPDDLKNVYVKSKNNTLIPLDTLVSVKRIIGPDIIERFNIFPAAKIMGEPALGYSSGQALNIMEEIAAKNLKEGYTLSWSSSSYQERASSSSGSNAFIFGLIMIFLILAAQYERWTLPIAVLMAVPFAVFGGMALTLVRGLENDLYFQIGLITLIGLSAKNAILIVEFAMQKIHSGMDMIEAAVEAAKLRLRPIIMTSLAFMMGCLPLAISSGAGSASRQAIGTGVIGGMLAATFIATFFIPTFFCLIYSFAEKIKGHK